ncbi:MAG: MotA/TolQ/ExbB proton channel family protein [Planctomycetota bacterium]|nr:MotA/TolQ/ExbB proton channel family protein [Planctomycetota bacterium]
MDLATIIGLVVGAGLIMAAIADQVSAFIDIPSVLIVIGGGTAATLMSMPLKRMLGLPSVVMKTFFVSKASKTALIADMVRYGEIARRDGILALEGVMDEIRDPFLTRAIQLAVDGNDPDAISATLTAEVDNLADRHGQGKQIFDLLGKYAPAFGMIGTLVGLILMLANLDDPSSIAPNMAVALLTTLYGALLANLVALPLADKLAQRSLEEQERMNIVREGVNSIQSGDNPKVVEQKLQIFLAPVDRSTR